MNRSSFLAHTRFVASSRKKTGRPGDWARYKQTAVRQTAAIEYKRAEEKRLYGSQGAASTVRKIDPLTGEVVAIIPARSELERVDKTMRLVRNLKRAKREK